MKEPHHCVSEESRNIIFPVDSVRREALVREVPPAEEPVDSATGAPVGKVPLVEGARRVRHQSTS